MSLIPITIFADFSCPYSFLAESVLRHRHGIDAELTPRAYELFPEPGELPHLALPSREWEVLEALAADAAIDLRERSFRPRTRKAHEAARFAREAGRELELRGEIYRAYWTEGLDIGRIDVLVGLAERAGVDPESLRIALDIDRFADAVGRDEELGDRLQIPGTPTIYLGIGTSARVLIGAYAAPDLNRYVDEAIQSRANLPDDG